MLGEHITGLGGQSLHLVDKDLEIRGLPPDGFRVSRQQESCIVSGVFQGVYYHK